MMQMYVEDQRLVSGTAFFEGFQSLLEDCLGLIAFLSNFCGPTENPDGDLSGGENAAFPACKQTA